MRSPRASVKPRLSRALFVTALLALCTPLVLPSASAAPVEIDPAPLGPSSSHHTCTAPVWCPDPERDRTWGYGSYGDAWYGINPCSQHTASKYFVYWAPIGPCNGYNWAFISCGTYRANGHDYAEAWCGKADARTGEVSLTAPAGYGGLADFPSACYLPPTQGMGGSFGSYDAKITTRVQIHDAGASSFSWYKLHLVVYKGYGRDCSSGHNPQEAVSWNVFRECYAASGCNDRGRTVWGTTKSFTMDPNYTYWVFTKAEVMGLNGFTIASPGTPSNPYGGDSQAVGSGGAYIRARVDYASIEIPKAGYDPILP